jgi:hypothetical protein
MGRYRSGKDTTEGYHRMDVGYLRRHGNLRPGTVFTLSWGRNGAPTALIQGCTTSNSIILSYSHKRGESGEWQRKEYPVELVRTPCHYGGERTWFLCPARGCGRRAAVLYGGGIFACRRCHQLVYESQREQPHYRALRRVQAIRMKLGGSGSMAEPFPEKPKGMHWRTYTQLVLEAEQADALSVPPWLFRRVASGP